MRRQHTCLAVGRTLARGQLRLRRSPPGVMPHQGPQERARHLHAQIFTRVVQARVRPGQRAPAPRRPRLLQPLRCRAARTCVSMRLRARASADLGLLKLFLAAPPAPPPAAPGAPGPWTEPAPLEGGPRGAAARGRGARTATASRAAVAPRGGRRARAPPARGDPLRATCTARARARAGRRVGGRHRATRAAPARAPRTGPPPRTPVRALSP